MVDLEVGVEGHVFDFDFVVDGEGIVCHFDSLDIFFSSPGCSFQQIIMVGACLVTGLDILVALSQKFWDWSCDYGGALSDLHIIWIVCLRMYIHLIEGIEGKYQKAVSISLNSLSPSPPHPSP